MKERINLAREVIHAALKMNVEGINRGSSGNVSVRYRDGFLVTPSGMAYDALKTSDVVHVHMDGHWDDNGRKPSSEWLFHRDIYAARPEINAVVHTHASYCSTLAVLGRDIPAFHYMVALAGGKDIRCADYGTTGSQTLADNAVKALDGRLACLLANHGAIACGADLGGAMALAVEMEDLARVYWQALQVGEPQLLDDAEMEKMLDIFKAYGAKAQDQSA